MVGEVVEGSTATYSKGVMENKDFDEFVKRRRHRPPQPIGIKSATISTDPLDRVFGLE